MESPTCRITESHCDTRRIIHWKTLIKSTVCFSRAKHSEFEPLKLNDSTIESLRSVAWKIVKRWHHCVISSGNIPTSHGEILPILLPSELGHFSKLPFPWIFRFCLHRERLPSAILLRTIKIMGGSSCNMCFALDGWCVTAKLKDRRKAKEVTRKITRKEETSKSKTLRRGQMETNLRRSHYLGLRENLELREWMV